MPANSKSQNYVEREDVLDLMWTTSKEQVRLFWGQLKSEILLCDEEKGI